MRSSDCCCCCHWIGRKILREHRRDLVRPGFTWTHSVLIHDQWDLCSRGHNSRGHMLFWHQGSCAVTECICSPQRVVSSILVLMNNHIDHSFRLCVVVIIALPVATPSKYKNSASYALGDFTNRESRRNRTGLQLKNPVSSKRVAQWICFYS